MQRFFSILAEAVTRFEGTVDKFTGDGIMAIFGAPVAHEDHARRACYAALQMLDDVAEYAAELRREQGLNFSTRIGINSGEVVAGAIGGGGDGDYTAIGHTVGLAQRMEALAEPGKAYLTEHTAELARGFLDLERPRRVRDQGGEPAGAGVRAGRGRRGALAARPRPRARLLALRRPRRRDGGARGGAGSAPATARATAVGVVAEPGIGKSRLCHEFAQRCRGEGIEVFEAQAQAHGKSIPFMPILQMLRSFFGIGDSDPEQLAREKIAGRALLLDPELRRRPAAALRLPRRPRSRAAGSADERRGAPARARRRRLPARQRARPAQDAGRWWSRTCTGSTRAARRCWRA